MRKPGGISLLALAVVVGLLGIAAPARAQAVTANPDPVDCGSVEVGSAGSATTQLTDTDFAGDDVDLVGSGGDCADFSFSPSSATLLLDIPAPIAVTFTPSLLGAESCTVEVLAGGNPIGSFTATGTGTGPVISAPASVDTGSARFGIHGTTSTNIPVSNTGNDDLFITALSLSGANPGDFAITTATPIDIPAGSAAQIQVTFAPTASGTRTATLAITSDAFGAPTTDVALTGTGTNATIDVTATVDFGVVLDDTTGTQTISVANAGPSPAGPLSVTTVTLADLSGWFAFAPSTGCAGQTTCTLDATVLVGSPLGLPVTCTPAPDDTTATNTASVTFQSDSDSSAGNVAELSCTGGRAQFVANPDPLGFGGVGLGSASTLGIAISNPGTSALTYTLAITPAGPFTFAGGCTSGCSIPAGGSAATVDVQFAPTALGATAAQITVSSDDPDAPASIGLTGTGLAAELSAPPSVTIGGVDVAGVGSATLTITNTGNVDLVIASANLDAASSAALTVAAGSTGAQTVAAGNTAQWTIACRPTAFGAANGHFAIASNAFGDAAASIPVSCTGLQGVLHVSAATVSFGGVRIGDTAPTQSITLSNVGNLTVTSLTQALADTTLGYTFTTTVPASLAAGSATTVTFEFAPTSTASGGSDVATFSGQSGTAPVTATTATTTLEGQALQAGYDVEPNALPFGDILWNASAEQQLAILTTGSAAITIETLDIAPDPTTNTQTGEFLATAITHDGTPVTLPFQLAGGSDSIVVTVTAAPANRTGPMAATLTVHSDLGTNPDRTVALTATATSPALTLPTGATVDFGGVDLAIGSATQTIALENTGTGPLGLGTILGSGSPTFTFALPAAGTVEAGSAVTIVATYTPTLEEADTATLTVPLVGLFDDTPTTQTIVVTGHGIDRHISVPASTSFPDTFVFPDTPPTVTIAVQDTGQATLHLSMVTSSTDYTVVNTAATFAVAGGSALDLNVQFAPTAIGSDNGTLTIMDDDRKVPMAVVNLLGNGIDRDVAIGPSMINLGTTGLGVAVRLSTKSPGGLQVVNMDPAHAFTVTKIDIVTTAGAAGAFSLDHAPTDQPLAAGGTDSYDLIFDPTIEGSYAATIDLFLDDDPMPRGTTVIGQAVFVDARGGGGCAVGGGGGTTGAALLVAAVGMLARRRRRATAALVVVAGTAAAHADSTRSLDLSVFDPAPATTGTGIELQSPTVGSSNDYAIWALVSYARKPLELVTSTDDFAIENRATYDLGGAFAFLGRFEVGARMPLYTQDGQGVMPGGIGYAEVPASGTARGDLTVHGKVQIYRDDALAVGAAVAVTLPTATAQQFAGVTSPEARIVALGSYAVVPALTVQANLGAVVRSSTQFENVDEKSGVVWGAGASLRVLDALWLDAEVFGEVVPSGIVDAPPAGQTMGATSTLATTEALAGVRYQLADHTQVEVAIGRGLDDGIGSPVVRGVVGVTYVPSARKLAPLHPPALAKPDGDADGDGIPDSVDKCPNDPEDKDDYQDQDGCPDPDNDGDGIPDALDKCPLDPEDIDGFQDADGCPDPDNDHDGIPDVYDKCPNDPEDKDGFEDLDGCPDPDNDHDGIPDVLDKCPNAPETINGFQDDDGCPDAGDPQVVISADHLDLLDTVSFVGTKIAAKSAKLLAQVASTMKAHGEIQRVRIAVHVQPTAHPDTDVQLTEGRAETVKQFLVAHGVPATALETHGYGGSKPIQPPRQKGAAAVNERVEFVIVDRLAK